MRLIIISAVLAMASLQTAQAQVLSMGKKAFRAVASQSKSTEVYAGDTKVEYKKVAALGGIDKRDISNLEIGESIGLGSNSQIDIGLVYSTVDANLKKLGGIAEVSTHYWYDAYTNDHFNVTLGFGFRAPGDNQGGADFVSLSDGLTKYDYSLNLGYDMNDFKIGLNTRFTDRNFIAAKSQSLVELYVNYYATSSVLLNVSYLSFNTSGGGDVGDVIAGTTSFQFVKEQYDTLSLGVGYGFNEACSVDLHFAQKLTSNAKNTDFSNTVALGYTHNY